MYSDPKSKRIQEEWKKKFDLYDADYQKLINEKGLTNWELECMGIWLNSNKRTTGYILYATRGSTNDLANETIWKGI